MVMKKSIAALLAVLLLLPVWSIPITAEEETVLYESELAFLKKVGVIAEDFPVDTVLTRGDFADMVIKLMHPDQDFTIAVEGAEPVFSDVPPDHKYYFSIKACKELRIVTSGVETAFRPDDPITIAEAVTMLVNALGYSPYAVAAGGYPTGYLTVGVNTGISKNVDMSLSEITGAVGAKLLYNALFADIVGIESVINSSVSVSVQPGKNLLSERLGISEYDALVTDNGVTSLFGDTMGDMEKIVLQDNATGNSITAFSAGTGIDNYVGARVKVFVKNNDETGRNEVVYFELHRNAKLETISSDTIVDVQPSYVEYEIDRETGKTQKLQFSSSAPLVLFNGQRFLEYTTDTLRPEDGILTFSDYDNDGRYDIVSVYSFNYYGGSSQGAARNIVVDRADAEEGYILCKFNPAMNLDIDPDKASYKVVSSKGSSLSDVSEYEIISVAQAPEPVDGKTFYFLMVSSESEPALVNAVTDTEIDTGEKLAELSSSILSVKPNYTSQLTSNTQVTLCYDVTGKVAYVIQPGGTTKNYGYLISAYADTGLEDTVKVKYFSKEGTVIVTNLSSKATIDGKRYDGPEAQMEALKTRPEGGTFLGTVDETAMVARPIIYATNSEGELTKIDTDTPNLPSTGELTAYSDQTFVKYSQEEIEQDNSLKAAYRSPRVAELKKGANLVDGKFYYSNSTLVISVPDIDTYGLNAYKQTAPDIQGQYGDNFNAELIKLYELERTDENYRILKTDQINVVNSCDIQAYDIDPDTGMAGLLVLRGRIDVPYYQNMSYSSSNPMYVFTEMSEIYDETEGKIMKKLYFTNDGTNHMSVKVDMDDLFFVYRSIIEGSQSNPYNRVVNPLKRGDVIRVFQENGYLTYMERVFESTALKDSYSTTLYPTMPRSPYTTTTSGGVRFPCNLRYLFGGQTQTYSVAAWYAKSVKSGWLTGYMGLNPATTNDGKLGQVKPEDPSTYTDQFVNIAGLGIVVVTKEADGEITVKEGTTADIKCYSDTKDLNNTSILLLKHTAFKVEQLFVYNGF